ncbi:GNAT family N-acetyltransferase [Streptomyces sp. A7024]|uniref:GNAT family N-acetyltransferase n=1 Tax=Streptomyces coryli TaxID=1128680 RepID=A0A6G4UDW6_9ACTN|nr:GNAT family N-acetyltransferase [Streptomyces coryli]NGN69547.1 GNAT family N-acetyltransferase [Streptomyces coryli]
MTSEKGRATVPTATVTRLTPADFRAAVPELAALLADTVAGGDSLGFLAPLGRAEAADWWRELEPAVEAGSLTVWAAPGPGGGIAGTVSLARTWKPNSRHRAEIVKLMVHPDARGRGLARGLLAAAEAEAARTGVGLLVLDTESGTPAERLYLAAGWTRYGKVPGYATDTAGVPRDCSFFHKVITTSA